MTLRWTQAQIDAHQARVHGNDKDHDPRTRTDVEQRAVDGAEGADEFKAALPCVIIRFTHYRRRAVDCDNFTTKWFVDGLVKNGILRNDTPKEVEEVRHRQVIIQSWETERTVLEIFEA